MSSTFHIPPVMPKSHAEQVTNLDSRLDSTNEM